MKTINIFVAILISASLFSCHGTASKDYDKKEKNDPDKMTVPSNDNSTNPSLADTAKTKKDTTTKN